MYCYFSGESEDDREELIVAANLACNSSRMHLGSIPCLSYLLYDFSHCWMNNIPLFLLAVVNACTSAFWKTVESLFASIGPDEKSYLSEQVI